MHHKNHVKFHICVNPLGAKTRCWFRLITQECSRSLLLMASRWIKECLERSYPTGTGDRDVPSFLESTLSCPHLWKSPGRDESHSYPAENRFSHHTASHRLRFQDRSQIQHSLPLRLMHLYAEYTWVKMFPELLKSAWKCLAFWHSGKVSQYHDTRFPLFILHKQGLDFFHGLLVVFLFCSLRRSKDTWRRLQL